MTTATETDTDALVADPTVITLESGVKVKIERLRLRQLMRFLKILTRGAGGALADLRLGEDTSQEDFASSVLLATVFAIPDAEQETIEFLQSVVSPAERIVAKRLSKAEMEINEDKELELAATLYNPELDDTVAIISALIEVEGPHIRALGKQLATLLKAQQKSEVAKKPSASSKAKSAS